MISVNDVASFLDEYAPASLAEDWDNVGLLVGDRQQQVTKVMTCLTVTPTTASEAIRSQADLVVVHHPLPFRAVKRLTSETAEGRLLLDLIAARVAIYSAHTAFDSAREGINQQLAEGLQLSDVAPLVAQTQVPLGAGRYGNLPQPLALKELAQKVKTFLEIENVQLVGASDQKLRRIAIACGSGGELLEPALAAGCECLVTGEMRFHGCLAAEANNLSLVLAGHFASERFGLEQLANVLAAQFPNLDVWASRDERDPLVWS